jgi:hypothetical protein
MREQLTAYQSPSNLKQEDITTIVINPSVADPTPTSSQAPGGSYDGDTDPTHWWNQYEPEGKETEAPEISGAPIAEEAPTAKIWNQPSKALDTPLEHLPVIPECFPLATAGHGQRKPVPLTQITMSASHWDILKNGTDKVFGPGYYYPIRGTPWDLGKRDE